MLEIRKHEQIIKKKKGSTSLILKHISYLLLFDTAKVSIIFKPAIAGVKKINFSLKYSFHRST